MKISFIRMLCIASLALSPLASVAQSSHGNKGRGSAKSSSTAKASHGNKSRGSAKTKARHTNNGRGPDPSRHNNGRGPDKSTSADTSLHTNNGRGPDPSRHNNGRGPDKSTSADTTPGATSPTEQ